MQDLQTKINQPKDRISIFSDSSEALLRVREIDQLNLKLYAHPESSIFKSDNVFKENNLFIEDFKSKINYT